MKYEYLIQIQVGNDYSVGMLCFPLETFHIHLYSIIGGTLYA